MSLLDIARMTLTTLEGPRRLKAHLKEATAEAS
jgi:hypothetical protein